MNDRPCTGGPTLNGATGAPLSLFEDRPETGAGREATYHGEPLLPPGRPHYGAERGNRRLASSLPSSLLLSHTP